MEEHGRRRRAAPLQEEASRAVDLEIRLHIAELADRLEAQGWSRDGAQEEAERRFGDVARIRAAMMRETIGMERRMRFRERVFSIGADLRYAVRGLRRNVTFAIALIGTVALGVGAAASVFTVLDALLLRPLPYEEPERLVEVQQQSGGRALAFLWSDRIEDWLHAVAPQRFGLHEFGSLVRTDGPEPQLLGVQIVSHELDEVLGVRAQIGRTFAAEDAVPGANRVMLTWAYWRRLGGEASVLGSTIELEGVPYEVVGVLPRDFKFPVASRHELWVAMGSDLTQAGRRLDRVYVVTRLGRGTTQEALQARLNSIGEALEREAPRKQGWGVELASVTRWRGNPDVVRGIWMLAGGVALMLLITLVNGVNLLLFRATDRAHELAVRAALGEGRSRLLRQLLTEGMVIGLAGGVLAVLLAIAAVSGLNQMLPAEFAFTSVYAFRVEQRVLLFTFGVSVFAGAILGLIPGIRALRWTGRRFDLLKGRRATRAEGRLNQVLVGFEVALAVTLLAGAGLLTHSLLRLTRVDPGFDAHGVVTMSLGLPESRYPTSAERAAFFQRLEQELESLPEVEAATVADGIPPSTGFSFGLELQAEGREPITSAQDFVLVPFISALPDYLSVLGGRLLAGRELMSGDVGTRNVLIDHQLASALWGGNAVGRRFRTSEKDDWHTVVGIFQHMTMLGLDNRKAPYAIIFPRDPARARPYMDVGIRPSVAPRASLTPIRRAVQRVDPQLPIRELAPARAALIDSVDKPRFLATVMVAVSVTSLLLAAIGVYGVLSYGVTQRRREVGIRMALGSQPSHVRTTVMRGGLIAAGAGVVVGIAAALALSRLIASLLYGVEPTDALTLGAVALLVCGAAVIASFIPAQRATRVDPVEVLRAE